MIDWPAISNQLLLGRLLRLPLKIIPKNTEISIKSGVCKGLKWYCILLPEGGRAFGGVPRANMALFFC